MFGDISLKKLILATLLFSISSLSNAALHTSTFTGKVEALMTCNIDADSSLMIAKIVASDSSSQIVYRGLGHKSYPELDAERKATYSTLLAAYTSGQEVTIYESPTTGGSVGQVHCGAAITHLMYGVQLGSF